jgi:hypothetical protein
LAALLDEDEESKVWLQVWRSPMAVVAPEDKKNGVAAL